jgi:ketosteroid isomerase-like protein
MEAMMLRRLTLIALLAIALAIPAAAQQVMSEQEARQVAESVLKSWNKAIQEKDAAGLAAQYTEDYVKVEPPPGGTMWGRATMEKNWSENFTGRYLPDPDTLLQVRPISNDAIWVVSMWSGTYNGPKGPEHPKGINGRVYVRDGSTWKIRMESAGYGPPSS